jgi:hypothetical protein
MDKQSYKPTGADRSLRLTTVFAWIPSFALLLAFGIVSNAVVPPLGLIPQTFSSITGIVHLAGRARSRAANFTMDLLCAVMLICFLIPGW